MTGIATLNVNPQDLINTSALFEESNSKVSSLTGEMVSLVTSLSSLWLGDASAAYISKFTALDDDIEKMVAMIREHVSDLQTIANNYMNGEVSNVDSVETLSVDVIV